MHDASEAGGEVEAAVEGNETDDGNTSDEEPEAGDDDDDEGKDHDREDDEEEEEEDGEGEEEQDDVGEEKYGWANEDGTPFGSGVEGPNEYHRPPDLPSRASQSPNKRKRNDDGDGHDEAGNKDDKIQEDGESTAVSDGSAFRFFDQEHRGQAPKSKRQRIDSTNSQ